MLLGVKIISVTIKVSDQSPKVVKSFAFLVNILVGRARPIKWQYISKILYQTPKALHLNSIVQRSCDFTSQWHICIISTCLSLCNTNTSYADSFSVSEKHVYYPLLFLRSIHFREYICICHDKYAHILVVEDNSCPNLFIFFLYLKSSQDGKFIFYFHVEKK